MLLKQVVTIPHSKDLFFRVHSHAFSSFTFTLLCENRKRSLILSDAVAEITELCMENSQKINCCDVTSIQEGRVSFSKPADKYILIGSNKYIRLICRFILECMTFQ